MQDNPAITKPDPVLSADLADRQNIRHGFFTRKGGVSTGIYQGLNTGMGSNDNPDHVRANRKKVTDWFGVGPDHLATAYQVHSPDALVIDRPFSSVEASTRPKVDGLVTATPGLVLGVQTADCGPVLFADAKASVIGAAHAGWKGATSGVMESTLTAMQSLGARLENIVAVLGPTISQANYEVGPEFAERLIAIDSDNAKWLAPSINPGHQMFDLPGYIVERLARAGVAASWTGQCTYADESSYYSYRRTTHRNEPDYGRQIATICISQANQE
jgi:YfiH family protein